MNLKVSTTLQRVTSIYYIYKFTCAFCAITHQKRLLWKRPNDTLVLEKNVWKGTFPSASRIAAFSTLSSVYYAIVPLFTSQIGMLFCLFKYKDQSSTNSCATLRKHDKDMIYLPDSHELLLRFPRAMNSCPLKLLLPKIPLRSRQNICTEHAQSQSNWYFKLKHVHTFSGVD